MAAGSPPDYDNVRMGGPQGLRIPTEQGKATFALKQVVLTPITFEDSATYESQNFPETPAHASAGANIDDLTLTLA